MDPEEQYHVFRAGGYALCQWEHMEAEYANMFALFRGKPGDLELVRAFGQIGSVYSYRIAQLRYSAEKYFVSHPNQDDEGLLHSLIGESDALSLERHRIAHGVTVLMLRIELEPPRWVWGYSAPWYAEHRLKTGDYPYHYDADTVAEFGMTFARLAQKVSCFREHLEISGRAAGRP